MSKFKTTITAHLLKIEEWQASEKLQLLKLTVPITNKDFKGTGVKNVASKSKLTS